MLAHESTYCVSVPGGSAEVSLNGLRAILGQVEAELYHSEIYGQMLSSLKALPEDLNRQVQCMVRAVGREAIRLALRKMVRKKPSVIMQAAAEFASCALPASAPTLHPPAPLPQDSSSGLAAVSGDRSLLLPAAPSVTQVDQTPRLTQGLTTLYPPIAPHVAKQLNANAHKKLSKKELAMQAALQAREACLQELGQVIRQARQDKSWSPYHLHIKTQIPLHQLEALETGHIERLPEDVYLRGFIRQVGNALGLDGNQMAASLPAIDTATAVVPSWQQSNRQSGLRLNSTHVYLGYAALMAGSIAWVSHQAVPQQAGSVAPSSPATVAPLPKALPTYPVSSKAHQKEAALSVKPTKATPATGNVSPPETSPL